MRIVDLGEEHEQVYFACLEDWSEEIKEAGDHKARWYPHMRDRGLRVKLALDDSGTPGGMIQYLPVEASFVEGRDLYFVLCVWVHGHKQGRGNFQGRGMGSALLDAAERDARERGAKGMAAWGIALPFWMKAAWFRRHGYRKADRDGLAVLLWKPFQEDAVPPRWIRQRKSPHPEPGQVTVTGLCSGWCPAQSMVFERARRAAEELGSRVVFREFDTLQGGVFDEWGITDAVFVDGKRLRSGPPPSYRRVREKIARRASKL